MNNRLSFTNLLFIGLLVLTIGGYFFARSIFSIQHYQQKYNQNIQSEIHKMNAFLDTLNLNQPPNKLSKNYLGLPFQFYLFNNNKLEFWNAYEGSLSEQKLSTYRKQEGIQLQEVKKTWYLTKVQKIGLDRQILLAQPLDILPIFHLDRDSLYQFNNDSHSTNIQLKGPMYYLPFAYQILFAVLFFVLLGYAIFMLNTFIVKWAETKNVNQGAIILIGFILLFQLLPLSTFIHTYFPDLSTLKQTFSISVMNTSLGKIFLNSILVLWAMSFFHREFEFKKPIQVNRSLGLVLQFFSFLVISLGFLVITKLFQSFILDTNIIFNFDNVFRLDIFSLLAMVSSVFLLFAFFLFSHRMMLSMVHLGLDRNQRLKALLPALAIMIPILLWTSSLPLLQMLLIILIYILLFDLFIESGPPTLTWILIWIVFFAAYSSVILFKFNLDKDQNRRMNYAQTLSIVSDTLAERQILQSLITEDPLKAFYTDLYFQKYYDVNRVSFQKVDLFNNYSGQSAFFKANSIDQEYLYVWPIDTTEVIGWSLKKEFNTGLFHEITQTPAFKGLDFLNENNLLISKCGEKLFNKGNVNHLPITSSNGRWARKLSSTNSIITYFADDGTTVTLEKQLGGYIKPMSLFSYLFMLLSILAILLLWLAKLGNSLPDSLNIPLIGKSSLRSKIQLAVFGLIVSSFIIIGYLTVSSFEYSTNNTNEDRWVKNVSAVLKDLEYQLESSSPQTDSLFYEKTAKSLAKIHNLEVHFYNESGSLLASSADYIFEGGYLNKRMPPNALNELKKGSILSIQEEEINGQTIKSTYVPIKFMKTPNRPYIGLPYLVNANTLNKEVADFLGTLLNIYVLLLLAAAAIAIVVANSITNPISAIGEKIKALKLGKNEALEWNSEDEIGELVKTYNKAIEKLEESTEKLKRSEREGAWREMAKQVAHEIKNPLTPMKLSIQYLMRVAQADPERVEEMLPRVSKTLVEQIEGLARIATEFSNFAKMPQAKNSHFIINDVVESVFNLFTQVPQEGLEVDLDMTSTSFQVFADKENLMRVINNLVKNAIQAIPDDKEGRIQMRLYQENEKVVVEVQDNGTGISDELKEKVFYPNFTTKNSGMGLGLAISKDIIDMAGGRIYFETKMGIGTTFYIKLPIISSSPIEH